MVNRNVIKFGEHLIYDAYGCDFEKLNSAELCKQALLTLVDMTKMRRLHEPCIIEASGNETLGGKDPGGYSGFVMVQESHISIHTFARRGFVTIDIYSCKPFNSEGIIEYLRDQFKCEHDNVIRLDRGLNYPIDNIYID